MESVSVMFPLKSIATFVVACLVLAAPASHAQHAADSGPQSDNLDVTMKLLPEGAKLPDAVTRTITLPSAASSRADSSSAAGLDKANANRGRRDKGLKEAEQARSEGRELGQEMRQQAAEQRENAEHGKRPSDAGPPGQRGGDNPTPNPAQPSSGSAPAAPPPPSPPAPSHPSPPVPSHASPPSH